MGKLAEHCTVNAPCLAPCLSLPPPASMRQCKFRMHVYGGMHATDTHMDRHRHTDRLASVILVILGTSNQAH